MQRLLNSRSIIVTSKQPPSYIYPIPKPWTTVHLTQYCVKLFLEGCVAQRSVPKHQTIAKSSRISDGQAINKVLFKKIPILSLKRSLSFFRNDVFGCSELSSSYLFIVCTLPRWPLYLRIVMWRPEIWK